MDTIDEDYRNKDISAKAYGRLSEKIEDEVDRLQEIISDLEKKYEKITIHHRFL
ncbi:hypothetical protein ACTHHL_09240 [Aeribacillus composti]|uniref:hypothetical protein n=1 Tax=Aeribacillus TaxID=1055323 RepID=UPI000B018AC1|nr:MULTISPECIES: hypothetical protein [Aeribacillus]MED0650716.1 hypothetical protein [Aeribacillus composti]MED0716155.1 hypothetical protein [Aeribacillus composti]MED0747395.1 hypothetical protein [Aeribacillus composti]MED4486776.1 hypothetical protein [Aeribacillus pallidus]